MRKKQNRNNKKKTMSISGCRTHRRRCCRFNRRLTVAFYFALFVSDDDFWLCLRFTQNNVDFLMCAFFSRCVYSVGFSLFLVLRHLQQQQQRQHITETRTTIIAYTQTQTSHIVNCLSARSTQTNAAFKDYKKRRKKPLLWQPSSPPKRTIALNEKLSNEWNETNHM